MTTETMARTTTALPRKQDVAARRTLQTTRADDIDIRLAVDGLGLGSLHYGLWDEGQPLVIDEVPEAQRHYTEVLIGRIPECAATVLDVGAGLGDNAIHMADKGLRVTCVSPSVSQRAHFKERVIPQHRDISFIRSTYEALDIEARFDAILMSESSNYFPIEKGLDQTLRYLKPGGHLVMGALFRKGDSEVFGEIHQLDDYIQAAKARGLILVDDLDVTEQVLPTLTLANAVVRHVPPVVNVLIDHYWTPFKTGHPIVSRLATRLFRKEIAGAQDLLTGKGQERLDPVSFRHYVTYRFLTLHDSRAM